MPRLELTSPVGPLKAIHDPPEAGATPPGRLRAALVCHPHPLHGGTMDNKVVHTLAKTLARRGLHVLRFNFRGAGGSAGEHDDGRGETDDARRALGELMDLAGLSAPGRLLVAGFSFGSFVGLSAAVGDGRVGALVAVAPPVDYYTYPAPDALDVPLCVLAAEEDELVDLGAVEAWAGPPRRPEDRRVRIAGAGHLFHARLGPLRDGLDDFLDGLAGGQAPGDTLPS